MKYYPKGWHTYKFLVTPQELKDILRGFHIVIYNRRVPADYIESNFANFVRDYESFYRLLTSGEKIEHIVIDNLLTGFSNNLSKCAYNWIETSGSPFVIVEQQYAHQWKGQENYNAICSVTDYLGKIYIDNHVLLVMGDEPMATRIVNKDGAILIIRWKYAPDYLTVEKLLENDIVTGAEPIEEVEVKWDSTELVLFDSLSPYCEASVKVFLSLQKTSCIIKTYLYQKDEVSLIIHSIQ